MIPLSLLIISIGYISIVCLTYILFGCMLMVELLDYVDNYHITTTYPSYTDSLVAH